MRTSTVLIATFLGVCSGLAGCGDDRGDVGATGPGLTEGATDAGDGDGDGDGDDDDDAGTDKFDAGDYDPDGDHGDVGCKKVDLLFVIDDSGSMENNQQQLVDSFPGFISGIKEELADVDGYHLGVVTTDEYGFNAPGCTGIGQLVTQTGGQASSASVCGPYADNATHMSEDDVLEDTFSCAAQVGIGGAPNERPIDGIRGALDPANAGPGGCNEGFLRDDALLVIVVITDEDDVPVPFSQETGSAGDPEDWYQDIVTAKGGVETNIVMLSIVAPEDLVGCAGLEAAAQRVPELTMMFTHGFLGSVCADTYDPFFEEAVSVIESACDGFVPPG